MSLSTAAHCTAKPIKLKVQFDTAFIYTVGKREGGVSDGGGGGGLHARLHLWSCAGMIEWGVCARPSLCVVVKKLETKWENIVLVLLYSGNNASGKKGKISGSEKNP